MRHGGRALAAAWALTVVSTAATPTIAWFTDTAAVVSGAFSAHTIRSMPAATCATTGGLLGAGDHAHITWAPLNDTRYEYFWEVRVAPAPHPHFSLAPGTLRADPNNPGGYQLSPARGVHPPRTLTDQDATGGLVALDVHYFLGDAAAPLLGPNRLYNYDILIWARLRGAPTWRSANTVTIPAHGWITPLAVTTTFQCGYDDTP